MNHYFLVPILLLFPVLLFAQSEAYQKRKAEQLAGRWLITCNMWN